MKRRLVLEYDTDAPRNACGTCPALENLFESPAMCLVYVRLLARIDYNPLRCMECLMNEDRWIPLEEGPPAPHVWVDVVDAYGEVERAFFADGAWYGARGVTKWKQRAKP